MKRSAIIILTLVTALAVTIPAYAKRPPKAPIDVSLDASPIWVHEAADIVAFALDITNGTDEPITVTITHAQGTITDLAIPASDTATWDPLYTVTVGAAIAEPELVGSATIAWDGGEVTATATAVIDPTPPCGFAYSGTGIGALTGTADLHHEFACIWTPPESGTWRVEMTPEASRVTRSSWTVRDHVPGNWCGSALARWRPGDDPVTGTVYLPGPEGTYGDGVCYSGGIGGTGWFPIGNPDSFYLVANDRVTVTWLGQGQR